MIKIKLKSLDFFDEASMKFVANEATVTEIVFNHSLVSIAKWEARWKHAFIKRQLTKEEMLDYIWCMAVEEPDITPMELLLRIDEKDMDRLNALITDKSTATVVISLGKESGSSSSTPMTAEMIYYYMIELNIPFECQHWHLNRLLTQIEVCSMKRKDSGQKNFKPSANEARARAELNARRLAAMRGGGV